VVAEISYIVKQLMLSNLRKWSVSSAVTSRLFIFIFINCVCCCEIRACQLHSHFLQLQLW